MVSECPLFCILSCVVTLRRFPLCYIWACSTNWRGQGPCSILILHLPKCLAPSPANSRHSINTCWSIQERLEWSISNSRHHLGARWLNRWILQPFFKATNSALAKGPCAWASRLQSPLAGWFLADFPAPKASRPLLNGQGIHQMICRLKVILCSLLFLVKKKIPVNPSFSGSCFSTYLGKSNIVVSSNYCTSILICMYVTRSHRCVMTQDQGSPAQDWGPWALVSSLLWAG